MAQSASTLQPPAGRQVPSAEQVLLRQTLTDPALQGPSPSLYPQALSLSHTSLAQTDAPVAGVQSPSSGGVCPAAVGMGAPLARRAVQAGAGSAAGSHHCVAALQLASSTQALPHAPEGSQMAPAWTAPAAAHVVTPPAAPQVAQALPPPGQYGADAGQAAVAAVPSSPLQALHVSDDESQIGVAPVQPEGSAGVHCAHSPAPALPEGLHTPLRQTAPPAQGPSPFS